MTKLNLILRISTGTFLLCAFYVFCNDVFCSLPPSILSCGIFESHRLLYGFVFLWLAFVAVNLRFRYKEWDI
jgi:hypothetical protein